MMNTYTASKTRKLTFAGNDLDSLVTLKNVGTGVMMSFRTSESTGLKRKADVTVSLPIRSVDFFDFPE